MRKSGGGGIVLLSFSLSLSPFSVSLPFFRIYRLSFLRRRRPSNGNEALSERAADAEDVNVVVA